MAQYRSIDPSDMARAVSALGATVFRDIDPSDVVSQIKKADATVRDRDRSDYVSAMNKIVGGGASQPVAALSLWNTNPALCLVNSFDLAKFHNGDTVVMAGVPAPWTSVNGPHQIANVGVGGSQFQLVGVDMSAALASIGSPTMTVTPP
jgi:hypothetical protein